jgi:hypothetical protein
MFRIIGSRRLAQAAALAFSVAVTGACNNIGLRADACPMPEGHALEPAFTQVRTALSARREQCALYFDAYVQRLLSIAEGDPGPETKRHFSEFLVWASAEGIVSKRQAQSLYNRYFSMKFVSLRGDYSTCSQACPNRATVMADMSQELMDKEIGLLKVSADSRSFYRADRLLQETELVLEATCAACGAAR